jgi:hypothetical protein
MHGVPSRTEVERCYRILELDSDASSDQVERSWHKLLEEWSPDRFAADPVLHERAHTRVHDLNYAREVLRENGVIHAPSAPAPRSSSHGVPSSRITWRRRPVMASTVFAGIALLALLMVRPLTGQKTRDVKPAVASASSERPASLIPPPAVEPRMVLMARGPLTVSVNLVDDGRILLPATTLQAGQTASVPRLGPTYVKYSAGENLEIQIDGRRYPMPDAGPSRAKIH